MRIPSLCVCVYRTRLTGLWFEIRMTMMGMLTSRVRSTVWRAVLCLVIRVRVRLRQKGVAWFLVLRWWARRPTVLRFLVRITISVCLCWVILKMLSNRVLPSIRLLQATNIPNEAHLLSIRVGSLRFRIRGAGLSTTRRKDMLAR